VQDVTNDGERRRERDREERERKQRERERRDEEPAVMGKRRGWKTGDSGREWTVRAISGGD